MDEWKPIYILFKTKSHLVVLCPPERHSWAKQAIVISLNYLILNVRTLYCSFFLDLEKGRERISS